MFQVNPLLGRGFTLKSQASFPSKDKSKKLTCRLLLSLFGALRNNISVDCPLTDYFSRPCPVENIIAGTSSAIYQHLLKKKIRYDLSTCQTRIIGIDYSFVIS